MSGQSYKRPPITEAVIEIRLAAAMDFAELEKAFKSLGSAYPHRQNVTNYDVAVEIPSESVEHRKTRYEKRNGIKLLSDDSTEILILWPLNLTVSQLAPYPGWTVFFERFVRDWKAWKRSAGYRKVARVGVRFINRIDVPVEDGVTETSGYLNVYPTLPDVLGPVTSYGVQAQTPLSDIGCGLTVNSAAVPSPLLRHFAYLLDLDIAMDKDPPQNDEGIYDLLNRIRVKKNEAFEACITAKARERFQL